MLKAANDEQRRANERINDRDSAGSHFKTNTTSQSADLPKSKCIDAAVLEAAGASGAASPTLAAFALWTASLAARLQPWLPFLGGIAQKTPRPVAEL